MMIVEPVDEQPVRRDMTFATVGIRSDEGMVAVFGRQRMPRGQEVNHRFQERQRTAASDRAFQIAAKFRGGDDLKHRLKYPSSSRRPFDRNDTFRDVSECLRIL